MPHSSKRTRVKPTIFILTGKNPLVSRGGYASYASILENTLGSLGYRPVFVTPPRALLKLTLLRNAPMTALLPLSLALVPSLVHNIRSQSFPIVWGIGPWSLTGAFVKLFLPQLQFTLISDYFTTIAHEFRAGKDAVFLNPFPFLLKFQTAIAAMSLIPLYTAFEKFLVSRSDAIVTHYQSTETILAEQFHLDSTKRIRLPVSMNNSTRVVRRPVSPPMILTIARHDPRKGIFDLLKAFAMLNRQKLQYSAVVIGSGSLLEFHRRQVRALHLNNVSLTGSAPDTTPYLEKASLFVLPSLEEGSSSLALLEAMRAGLPIVATNVDGIPEDVKHNQSALLVSPYRPDALALAIRRALMSPRLAERLGKNAAKAFHQAHIRHRQMQQMKQFLNRLYP